MSREGSGNRYWTSSDELDAELTSAGFEIVFRRRRADTEVDDPGIGDALLRVARRR